MRKKKEEEWRKGPDRNCEKRSGKERPWKGQLSGKVQIWGNFHGRLLQGPWTEKDQVEESIFASRGSLLLFFQDANEMLSWPTRGETVFLVHVAGMEHDQIIREAIVKCYSTALLLQCLCRYCKCLVWRWHWIRLFMFMRKHKEGEHHLPTPATDGFKCLTYTLCCGRDTVNGSQLILGH